jgi:putative ABC transport system permease protein
MTFEIVGTFTRGPDPSAFISRLDYLQDTLHQPVNVQLIWVRCANLSGADLVKAAIDESFHNADSETETFNEKTYLANYVAPFKPVVTIIEAMGLYAIIAIGLAVLNASAMSIRERSKEIATLRAIGFGGASIVASLLVETTVIAIAGGALGVAASWLILSRLGGAVPALGPLLGFGLPLPVVAAGLAIAAAIGLLSGLIPALGAMRVSVATSLRKVV